MADRPTENPNVDPETLALLHKVGVERHDLGERLARHEYQALKRELTIGTPFQLQVSLAGRSGAVVPAPELTMNSEILAKLPTLPVPLGRIAWVRRPEDLPVSGILIGQEPPSALSQLLLPLLTEHHRQPFARLVFLCRTLTPVHVLARYGFLCECIGNAELTDVARMMEGRFGLDQIRDLKSGELLWGAQS